MLAGETKHIKECKFAPSLHFILAFDWMIASTLEIGIKTKSDKIQGCKYLDFVGSIFLFLCSIILFYVGLQFLVCSSAICNQRLAATAFRLS